MKTMQRKPRPAPFKVGDVVEFIGPERGGIICEDGSLLLRIGRRGAITEMWPGRQGTGLYLDLHDGEEPILDETSDGCNVVQFDVAFGYSTRNGVQTPCRTRLIRREDGKLWRLAK